MRLSFRPARIRTLLMISFLGATVAVLAAIPGRWEGERNSQHAYVPLRPLSAEEAAVLLEQGWDEEPPKLASVTRLSASTVWVATAWYLIPWESPEREGKGKVLMSRGKHHLLSAANWESYYNLHRVDRRSLEQVLGKPLTDADVDVERFADWEVSFESYRLWQYAFAESVILGFAFFLLLIAPRLLPRHPASLLLLPGVLFLWWFGLLFVILRYAPALWDADWFYQRILIEEFAIWGYYLLLIGPSFTVYLLSIYALLTYLFTRGTAWAMRRWSSRRLKQGAIA
jgi:hypothetical protein